MLDDNNHLIQCIMDSQNKGKTSECSQVSPAYSRVA
ncbi:SS18 isoform 5 [Pongo abelii]|nr:SS18 isoform 5 [Pongo abelii]